MYKLKLFSGANGLWWRRALIIMIVVLYGWTFQKTFKNTGECTTLWGFSSESIYAAVSELKYGAKPFHTYQKVKEVMWDSVADSIAKRNGRNECGPDVSSINQAMNRALELKELGQEIYVRTSLLGTELPGYALLCKIGFYFFGFKFESIFYAYWLLLALPALILLISFHDKNSVLYVLFLYTIALSAILQTQGFLEEGILRARHFVVFTILPVFHLALVMANAQNKQRWFIYFGAAIQALILSWAVFTRPAGLYQFLYLLTIAVVFFIYYVRKKRWRALIKVAYPIMLILVCYGSLRIYGASPVTSNSLTSASSLTSRGCIWHPFLLGLGAHPDATAKHGLAWSDTAVIDIIKKRAPEYGLVWEGVYTDFAHEKNVIVQCSKEYETILKDEYFRIFRQDPWFVISAYFYDVIEYFRLYFSQLRPGEWSAYHNFGIWDVVSGEALILISLGLAILFRMASAPKIKFQPLGLFVPGFLFAIPIPVLVYPVNHAIADSSVYLTVFLFAVFVEAGVIALQIFVQSLAGIFMRKDKI